MYRTKVRIHYPAGRGEVVLRTGTNWDHDLEAEHVSDNGEVHEFSVSSPMASLEFKPCLRQAGHLHWSSGPNKLLLLSGISPQDFYPAFFSGIRGEVTGLISFPSSVLNRNMRLRIYLPPGYHENELKRYPVLYMHDGTNLFFPEESFLGEEWRMDETLDLLNSMNAIDRIIVVGIYAEDRFYEYTRPGYEFYGKSLIEEIKPFIDGHFRTLSVPEQTAVMGSSLGGGVSFYLAWERPDVFGNAGCLSSTFWFQNDLFERVRGESMEERSKVKFYLDSGWPGDNYEATMSMAGALLERGLVFGRDFLYFSFPFAKHNEGTWAARVHLPLQLFSGKISRAATK